MLFNKGIIEKKKNEYIVTQVVAHDPQFAIVSKPAQRDSKITHRVARYENYELKPKNKLEKYESRHFSFKKLGKCNICLFAFIFIVYLVFVLLAMSSLSGNQIPLQFSTEASNYTNILKQYC